MSDKVKHYCNGVTCSFKPVKFNTFEYLYCSTCKSEVDEDLVERVAWYKANSNINPHMQMDEMMMEDRQKRDDQDEQMDMFDLWTV
jgi:hypothetical protein